MVTIPPDTTTTQLNHDLDRLHQRKTDWLQVDIPQRIRYLQQCLDIMGERAEQWVQLCCDAKGLDPVQPVAGEEWLVGPAFFNRHTRLLIQALQAQGSPVPPSLTPRANQQMVAKVFPQSWMEALLFPGFEAEVWLQPGQPTTQGSIYQSSPSGPGSVCLVLGAGNISSIPTSDCLHKLFVTNQVTLLKLNPITAYLGPLIEAIFQPLIADGFVAIAYGGAGVGQYLCHHPQVDTIHITGSQRTYSTIVGSFPPDKSKPITAELGCITPVLIVPGSWSDSDIRYQARQVASMLVHNAGCNCNAAKLLVTAQGWPQREVFLAALRQELTQVPPRKAYYPGSVATFNRFQSTYPQAETIGAGDDSTLPWLLIPNIPADPSELALQTEAFCGVLSEVPLEVSDPADFLVSAVNFVNTNVWGTLSCMLFIQPATAKVCATELDQALDHLQYGAIGVNCWSATAYGLMVTGWGSFPTPDPTAPIQSGTGCVHNTFLFDHPQKSVVKAPFRLPITPPWFYTHRSMKQLGSLFSQFEADPKAWKALGVLWMGLQS